MVVWCLLCPSVCPSPWRKRVGAHRWRALPPTVSESEVCRGRLCKRPQTFSREETERCRGWHHPDKRPKSLCYKGFREGLSDSCKGRGWGYPISHSELVKDDGSNPLASTYERSLKKVRRWSAIRHQPPPLDSPGPKVNGLQEFRLGRVGRRCSLIRNDAVFRGFPL